MPYDYNLMVYAMELWEATLDLQAHATDPDVKQAINDAFEAYGTCQMRDTVSRLVPYCIRDFHASDDYGNICFDWEYCPKWLAQLDWKAVADTGAYKPDLTELLGPIPEVFADA